MLLGFERRKKENFADSRERNAAKKKRKTVSNDIVTQKRFSSSLPASKIELH